MAFAFERGTVVDARNTSGQTALIAALKEATAFGHRCGPLVTVEAVRFLLQSGADPEATDSLGWTAIHHAVGVADRRFLEVILAHGGKPRHVTGQGYSTLTTACFQPAGPKKLEILRVLRDQGAALDTRSRFGEFPLGVCLHFGDLDAMRFLLDMGADPGPLNWTPLHHAVAMGDRSGLEGCATTPVAINQPDDCSGNPPWALACIRGDMAWIRWLAEHGADLARIGRHGQGVLHLAARHGHPNVVDWLVGHGADPDGADAFGRTPVHAAVESGAIGCVRALLQRGADARLADQGQSLPVHAARSLAMVEVLVEFGDAEVDTVDGCGCWPLKVAAEDNDAQRVAWLLRHGAEVDRTSTGETALHAAVRCDSREVLSLLLAAGADPNRQDVDGQTPLFGARSREAIRSLLDAGADPTITDQAAWDPGRWLEDPILLAALRE